MGWEYREVTILSLEINNNLLFWFIINGYNSLKASVHVRRPELLPPGQKIRAAPILLMSQPMYFNGNLFLFFSFLLLTMLLFLTPLIVNIVPDIGEMMLASFAMSTQFDGENWYAFVRFFDFIIIFVLLTWQRWMGEKYDGVRACWNPLVHKLYLLFLLPFTLISHYFIFEFSKIFTKRKRVKYTT